MKGREFSKHESRGVNIKTERYPRVLDEMENLFQREGNVTHERGLFYGRKQKENETFEKFHAELSALAGRCDFANAAENVRAIFIMNMRESDCQRDLSRLTKLPEKFTGSHYLTNVGSVHINHTRENRPHQRRRYLLNKNQLRT